MSESFSERLMCQVERFATHVLTEFEQQGNRVELHGDRVEPATVASRAGLLPVILWWMNEFYTETFLGELPGKLIVRDLRFTPEVASPARYAVEVDFGEGHADATSPSVFFFALSSFLRDEITSPALRAANVLDLTHVVDHFLDWAALNVPDTEQDPALLH